MLSLLLLVAAVSAVPLDPPEKCGYESCTQAEAGVLNVHIVPHTHDDVGWLKTVDQYYYGSRNNIQKAGVQYIIDSVVKELWEDPKRRFMYVETAFFWKWWTRQSDDVRHKVHTLVRQGRLQFVGGAWSMNDEAASHYQSTVDQFTWGLRKLNETFGSCGMPRVGWQIDPFGHSREFASLLAAMGYDGLFLGRIDYQDKNARLHQKRMEMLWRGDDDLGKPSDIFTGVLYNTYSPPPGFCFDVLCSDEPIVDDPDSPMYNVDDRVDTFLAICRNMSAGYRTKNILVTMGEDFQYQDAAMWYKNLDKLITYANLKAGKEGLPVKLFYSTPDCYLKAVKDAVPKLPTKQDDFFPYASDPTAYWTGYFTSRPTTKFLERQANDYLQMVKHLQVLTGLPAHNKFIIDELKSAVGVMQHHDAITGTEKQHVTRDYERIVTAALDDASILAAQAFNKILQPSTHVEATYTFARCRLNESSCHTTEQADTFVVTIYNPVAWNTKEPIRVPVREGSYKVVAPNGDEIDSQLLELPKSVTSIPTRTSEATHELVFMAHLHPLGVKTFYVQKTKKTKRHAKKDREYYDINNYWKNIKTIDIASIDAEKSIDADKSRPKDQIPLPVASSKDVGSVNMDVEDLEMLKGDGVRVEGLEKLVEEKTKVRGAGRNLEKPSYPSLSEEEMRMLSDDPMLVERYQDYYLENEYLKLRVDNSTGQVTHVIQGEVSTSMQVGFYYWTGAVGNNSKPEYRSSGAYIFRPRETSPKALSSKPSKTFKGPVVQEIRMETDENTASSIRVYVGLPYIEHDFVIGPIDISDDIGKEYVVRYNTNVLNNGIFYTDSNGRQMLKRKLNERPQWNLTLEEPIAGNYYPVTNEIYIENDNLRVSVLTDRSQGGTSLEEGSIELMLHRRLLHDDAFGVDEALNETANGKGLVMRGKHRILIHNPEEDSILNERMHILQMHLTPIVYVADASHVSLSDWLTYNNCFKPAKELPLGLHLLTLEPWNENRILIRLENYKDGGAKSNIQIDLNDIFTNLKFKSIRETTLAANRWLDEYEKWQWESEDFVDNFNDDYNNFGPKVLAKDDNDVAVNDGFKITLKGKQIRTFIAEYELK
ncbi:lysosomal alpha-mannosidase-like isoform X1 [Aricia agestis]|uniref:lysosomal alpha-mannosidase-like isoform X1 n=1 Tax=Aricia agestis TaxID=91739 RepID=UPI001C20343E|nr:lysosomal alpha-mannosidase-like isoform X1 [Aricia agestis]